VDASGNITNSQGLPLEVVETQSGELVSFDSEKHDVLDKFVLTIELLKNYAIKVDNLTLTEYHDRNEKDIYYSLVNLSKT